MNIRHATLAVVATSIFILTACERLFEPTCHALTSDLNVALDQALDAHNGCTQDSDCVVASIDTACRGACPVAIRADAKPSFDAEIVNIDERVCIATEFAAVCGFATPGCATATAQCVAGRCEMVP